MFLKAQRIHFIGIGGIGMSGSAEILLSLGAYRISGSDLRRSEVTARLEKLADLVIAHSKKFLFGSLAVTLAIIAMMPTLQFEDQL